MTLSEDKTGVPPPVLVDALRDRYELERELGRGGMATVYLAQDLRHKRHVALKVLHPALAQTLGPERFQREIELAARLQHPHILTVHDSGTAAGQLWFTMPFVEGESLRDRLRREKQLPIEDALRIATETARALDHAHRHGVVHRDIKPENILLTNEGDTLVADFGIARALATGAGGADERLTETGMALGTPAYMSPEQASGAEVDARTDTYALGCMLYEMLAGEPPFTGPTPQSVIARRLSGEVPQVRRLRPAVPDEVGSAVAKALAPLAADRFQTAAELARALAAGHGSDAGNATVTAGGTRRLWKVPPLAALALVLVIGVLGLVLWARSGPRAPGAATLRDPPETDTASDTSQHPFPVQPSVAVLPFANLSPDPANEYFSDGMTEELITALSRVEGLRVAARASSFAFKGKPLDISEVARKLDVSSVLDGSVRRAGQRLRVTAELVDTRNGTRLWADRYDRELRDVFLVQDELARAIVSALRVPLELGSRPGMALARVGTEDPAAHDLYLQGRFLWNQRTYESVRSAAGFFKRAIARDSNYAEAWAGLADTYLILPQAGRVRPRDMYPKARTAAARALALDSTLAEAHTSLGLLHMYADYDWRGAEAAFRRAIALNPSYATAHQWYSSYLATVGQLEAALTEIERARALDPLSRIISANMGNRLAALGRYDEALRQMRLTIELDANFVGGHHGLCYVYALKGLPREGIPACERAVALSPSSADMGLLAWVYATSGDRAKATAIVRELEARSRREYVSPYQMASAYRGLGETERMFAWLDSAYAVRDPRLAGNISQNPLWAPVRDDPRFARLRARMGLPP